MKKIFKWGGIIFLGLVVVGLLVPDSKKSNSNSIGESNSLEFTQVGYHKGENRLRYFSFQVETKGLDIESLSMEHYDEIKKHGESQRNTEGQITASFYYYTPDIAPNITVASSQVANDMAHESNPFVAVWRMPNGQINVIKNPE